MESSSQNIRGYSEIFLQCTILCCQVIFLLQYFSSVDDTTMSFTVAKMVANCLAYTNSCVNPILYAFLSDNFRKAFFRLVACCCSPAGGGGAGGGGGFTALRKMEMEQTHVACRHQSAAVLQVPAAAASAAAAGRQRRLDLDDDDGDIETATAALTQQTSL